MQTQPLVPQQAQPIYQRVGHCLLSALDAKITKKTITILGMAAMTGGSLALCQFAPAYVKAVLWLTAGVSGFNTLMKVKEYASNLAANKNPSLTPVVRTAFVTTALLSTQLLAIQATSLVRSSYALYRSTQSRQALHSFYNFSYITTSLSFGTPIAFNCMKATRFFFNFIIKREGLHIEKINHILQYFRKGEYSRAIILIGQDTGMLYNPTVRSFFSQERLQNTLTAVIPEMSNEELTKFLESLTDNEIPLALLINAMTQDQVRNVYLPFIQKAFEGVVIDEIIDTYHQIKRELPNLNDLPTVQRHLTKVNQYITQLSRTISIKRSFGENYAQFRAIADESKKSLIQNSIVKCMDPCQKLHNQLTDMSDEGIRKPLIDLANRLEDKDEEDDQDELAYEVLGSLGIFTTADCRVYARILGVEGGNEVMANVSRVLDERGLGTRRQLLDVGIHPKKGEKLDADEIKRRLIETIQTAPVKPPVMESVYLIVSGVSNVTSSAASCFGAVARKVDRLGSYALFLAFDASQYALIASIYPKYFFLSTVIAACFEPFLERSGFQQPQTGLIMAERARFFSNSTLRGRIRMMAFDSWGTRFQLAFGRFGTCITGYNLGRSLMRQMWSLRGRITHVFSSR